MQQTMQYVHTTQNTFITDFVVWSFRKAASSIIIVSPPAVSTTVTYLYKAEALEQNGLLAFYYSVHIRYFR